MTPVKYSAILGLNTLPLNDDMQINKANLQTLAKQAGENLREQSKEVQLNAYARIRVIEQFFEELKAEIEPMIVDHIAMFEHPTIKISTSTRKTFEYEGDATYDALAKERSSIKGLIDVFDEKIKERQKYLEALGKSNSNDVVDVDTGEISKPARLVSTKTSIRTTISN